ncbi:MAG: hypothetical protein GXY76_19690 [Chloroflexi bacterium]|nr:hypothetical protein [Chloroflexota bacterium]
MKMMHRTAALIRPKPPYLEWINRFHPPDAPMSADQVARAASVFLLPEFPRDEDRESYLRRISDDIFVVELESWLVDRRLWPSPRTYALFQEWFEVEWHYMTYDASAEPGSAPLDDEGSP